MMFKTPAKQQALAFIKFELKALVG